MSKIDTSMCLKTARENYTARTGVKLYQQDVADLIGLSVESVKRYENGKSLAPNDVVKRMSEIYEAPNLPLEYLKETNELADAVLPNCAKGDLSNIVMYLRVKSRGIKELIEELEDIAWDDVVDESEMAKYKEIVDQLLDICGGILPLRAYLRAVKGRE